MSEPKDAGLRRPQGDASVEYKQPSVDASTTEVQRERPAEMQQERPAIWTTAAGLFAIMFLWWGVSPTVSLGPNVLSLSLGIGFASLTMYAWRKGDPRSRTVSQAVLLWVGVAGVLLPILLVGGSLLLLRGQLQNQFR